MSKTPNETDVTVGARVRARRKELGISQSTLGEQLGISFQQVQKYEKGTNRIGAGRLLAMATALAVPVSYFFPQADTTDPNLTPSEALILMGMPGAIELLRDFAQIEDGGVRRSLAMLARALAESGFRRSPEMPRRN